MSRYSDSSLTSGLGRRKRSHRGRGFFSDLWDGIKSVAPVVNNVLKSTGLASKALGFVPGVGGVLSSGARALGYGRRARRRGCGRRRVHRRGGMKSVASLIRTMHGMRRRRVGGARRRVRRGKGILL